jgi:hypothetical protein
LKSLRLKIRPVVPSGGLSFPKMPFLDVNGRWVDAIWTHIFFPIGMAVRRSGLLWIKAQLFRLMEMNNASFFLAKRPSAAWP